MEGRTQGRVLSLLGQLEEKVTSPDADCQGWVAYGHPGHPVSVFWNREAVDAPPLDGALTTCFSWVWELGMR